MRHGGVSHLVPLVLCASLTAQTPQFAERDPEPVFETPAWRVGAGWVATGDMDGDGDEDLVAPDGRVFFNRGGYFEVVETTGPIPRGPVILFDLDADGDLDVASSRPVGGRGPNALFVWTNDGTGALREETGLRTPVVSPWQFVLHAVDVDIDGDLDILGANLDGLTLLENRSGVFVDVTSTNVPAVRHAYAVAVLDADLDGDPDLVTRNGALLINSGTGRFAYASNSGLQASSLPRADVVRVLAGDVDGDGRDDVVIDERIWLNRGGRFVAGAPLPGAASGMAAWELADFDADGDLDLVVDRSPLLTPASTPDVLVLRNDGGGVFSIWQRLDDGYGPTATFDADGDGDVDLLVFAEAARFYVNDGSGRLFLANADRADARSIFAVADFDGDGDPDGITHEFRYLENDGDGRFTDTTGGRFPALPPIARPSRASDLDLDGDVDLHVTTWSGAVVLLNAGNGRFVLRDASTVPYWWTAPRSAVVDVERDGDPDLVISPVGQRDELLINDGNGGFTPSVGGLPPLTGSTRSFLVADVDVDGDPDLIRLSDTVDVLLNDGFGAFSPSPFLLPVANPGQGLTVGDVDGDGDPDLAGDYSMWINDGTGRFADEAASRLPPRVVGSRVGGFADVDSDGDLDLFGWVEDVGMTLFVNDGSGRFVDVSATRIERGAPAVGGWWVDVDSDGDVEVLDSRGNALVNHERQLSSPGTPTPGRDYTLIVHSQPGYAVTPRLVFPLLATAPARIEIPGVGRLGVDPAAAVSLPLIVLTASQSEARIVLPVPNVPALRGLSLWAQAGIADLQSGLRLTNRVSDVVR